MLFLEKEKIWQFFENIKDEYDIFVPALDKNSTIIDFYKLENIDNKNISISFLEKTKKSAKSIFYPPTEDIFNFEYLKDINNPDFTQIKITGSAKNKYMLKNALKESINESRDILENTESNNKKLQKKKLLFGLKPCDTRGINCIDLFFLEDGKEDINYMSKRNDSILISIGCNTIFPDCFCTSVGGHPFNFELADIGLVDIGDVFAFVKVSQREDIQNLLKQNDELFIKREMSQDEKNVVDNMIKNSESKFLLKEEKFEGEHLGKILDNIFSQEEFWQEISDKCISCGACTYVCPTCTCFNIGDEIKDLKGKRYRSWDFCTNFYYTLEASGHNPRGKLYQRYRNKVNCKFNYFFKRNRLLYCVGCGRCIDVCPVGMDIREILIEVKNKLLDE